MVISQTNLNPQIRAKFGALLLQSEPNLLPTATNHDDTGRDYSDYNPQSNTASAPMSPTVYTASSPSNGEASPYGMSPWNNPSPYTKSPWIISSPMIDSTAEIDYKNWKTNNQNGLIGSLVRKEGHIYSLAVAGDLLYTGSDSRNIRVWKSLKEFTGFKSNSGLVKAIVVNDWRIFTGHQDGKIRVWKVSSTNPKNHRRIGNLPTFKDFVKSSMNPRNYVEVRRHRNVVRIRHYDAVSCMSLNEEQGVLYSASWDKTVKVWRLADLKCLESITAHDDAVNAVVSAFGNLVFTGSADGTMKMWRREVLGKTTKHLLVQVLLEQESAVTALAVSRPSDVIYCGSSDGVVNYWVKEKQYLCHGGMLKGHKLAILCLATAGHGLLLSGSADRTICVWRREVEDGSHTCLSFLTGHTGPVKCLAVEEDLSDDHDEDRDQDRRWIVYSGSLDKSVKVWRVKE